MANICMLDLDHTLVLALVKNNDFINKPHYSFDDLNIYFRKDLSNFIQNIFSKFDIVIVWSLGVRDYVEAVCAKIFENTRYPNLVLSRDQALHYKDYNIYMKDTNTIYDFLIKQNITIKNFYFIDDNPKNIILHPNIKLLVIPPFLGSLDEALNNILLELIL